MAIIIHNISGDDFDYTGLNKYQVLINQKVIAEFEHTRSDGLAECLRKAADAVGDENRIENQVKYKLMMDLLGEL